VSNPSTMSAPAPAVWMPAVRCGTGADVFTERLAAGLMERSIRCEITWLPHRAEYAPWSVPAIEPPSWANVVHINSWLPPRFVPDKLPLVVTVHHWVHDPTLAPHQTLAQRLYHRLHILPIERHNLMRARRIVAVSRYTAAQAERALGISGITVIHNGIDTNRAFTPGPSRQVPHSPFRLLYVGSWSRRKGCDLLEPIMLRLGRDFELLCVTPDPARARARAPNISITGPKSDRELVELYRSSDALLHPARLEGFGLTACEAMACGLPVVASAASALPEVVAEGETGLLCAPGDVGAFAAAVQRLADNPACWAMICRNARERAKRCFSLSRMVDAYAEAYEKVLDLPAAAIR